MKPITQRRKKEASAVTAASAQIATDPQRPASIAKAALSSFNPNKNQTMKLEKLRSQYLQHRHLFISGEEIQALMLAMGICQKEIDQLKNINNSLAQDPTLGFRQSRNGRFCFDSHHDIFNRLEHQPFLLSAEEDFVRHDSGKVRRFRGIQDELQLNLAFHALLSIKYSITRDVVVKQRPALDYGSALSVSTVFQLRTVTTPESLGQPALEGVHSDGVDHTMTTFLGASNMASNSARTQLHDPRQQNGLAWDNVDKDLIVGSIQHSSFLDTLLVVDHEYKHSVSPVFAAKENMRAYRDMLIVFSR